MFRSFTNWAYSIYQIFHSQQQDNKMQVKFWVKTSRMLDVKETVEIEDGLHEEDIKDILEDWCRKQFDFDGTDSFIKYGWN